MNQNELEISQQIIKRCEAVIKQAQAQYSLPMAALKLISVNCDLTGKSCGKIEFRYSGFRQLKSIKIRFNMQAAQLELQDMLNNTVPHEVAHLVIALCPKQYQQTAHGKDWQKVCLALGGNGKVYHKLTLTNARTQRQWQYVDSLGQAHQLSTVRHNRLQRGAVYHVKKTGAKIEPTGFKDSLDYP